MSDNGRREDKVYLNDSEKAHFMMFYFMLILCCQGAPGPSVYGAAMQGWFQRAPVYKGPGYQGDEAKSQEVGLRLYLVLLNPCI